MKIAVSEHNRLFFCVNCFLALMLLGLPLVYDNRFFNITEAKSIYFYVLSSGIVLICTVLTAVVFFLDNDRKKRRLAVKELSALDICMLAFGLFIFLSGALSVYQSDVWLGENSRYQGVITVMLYISVYFAVSRNYRFSQSFILCCVGALSVVSLLGVLNCFDIDALGMLKGVSSQYKQDFLSTIGNKNFYSSYFCLMLPLLLCGYCGTKETVSRVIYTVSLIIAAFGMSVTGSESFVIGFVFSVLVFVLFLLNDGERLKKYLTGIVLILVTAQVFRIIYHFAPVKIVPYSELLLFLLHPAVTAAIILICCAVIIALIKKPELLVKIKIIYLIAFSLILSGLAVLFIVSNVHTLGSLDKYFRFTDEWGTHRGGIWKQCIELYGKFTLKEKLFGIGPESLQRIFETKNALLGGRVDQAHNEYLQYLLTSGLAGLLSYISVIVCTVITVVKKLRDDVFAVALISGLAAFWFQAIVNIAQPFTTPLMYIFISVIAGIYRNKCRQENETKKLHCKQ